VIQYIRHSDTIYTQDNTLLYHPLYENSQRC